MVTDTCNFNYKQLAWVLSLQVIMRRTVNAVKLTGSLNFCMHKLKLACYKIQQHC